MGQLLRDLSLAPRGIRHKLGIVFALVSLIPMLVCGFFMVYYIFPTVNTYWDILLILIITLVLILLGCYLARQIIYPIVEIAAHAKGIAEGNVGQELPVSSEDEIGELSGSLNKLSTRLKDNMTELRSYGEKIKQINMEINKKVFALSSLLQIGNLITTAANLDEVFNLIVEKLSQLEAGGSAFLMLLDKTSGNLSLRAQRNLEAAMPEPIKVKIGQGLLGKLFEDASPLVIDQQKKPAAKDNNLVKMLRAENMAVLPITSSGKVIGIIGTATNAENFHFSDDEVELIGVFAKQVAVAIENDFLLRKTEELTVKDDVTGLYNENYIRIRLDEEIKRAVSYQRPCSFAILEIDNFKQYRQAQGEIGTEKALKKVAQTLTGSTTDIDKTARFSEHQFALVLPERNKQQAVNLAKNIIKEIERFNSRPDRLKHSVSLVLRGGISATPLDGANSVELINKALSSIEKARAKGGNGVISS